MSSHVLAGLRKRRHLHVGVDTEDLADRDCQVGSVGRHDVNGRDESAEERLRVVIEAYRLLVRQHYA